MDHLYRSSCGIHPFDKNLAFVGGPMVGIFSKERKGTFEALSRKGALHKTYINPIGLELFVGEEPCMKRYRCWYPLYRIFLQELVSFIEGLGPIPSVHDYLT